MRTYMIVVLEDMFPDRVQGETCYSASEENERVDVDWNPIGEELANLLICQLRVRRQSSG